MSIMVTGDLESKINHLSASFGGAAPTGASAFDKASMFMRSPFIATSTFEVLTKYKPVISYDGANWSLALDGFAGLENAELVDLLAEGYKLVKLAEEETKPKPAVLWMKVDGEHVEISQHEPSDPENWKKLVEEQLDQKK